MDALEKRIRKIDYKKLNSEKRFCNNKIIEEVARELNITKELVERVAQSQSKFTVQIMRQGGMETITYCYIGKFKVNLYRVHKMMSNSLRS